MKRTHNPDANIAALAGVMDESEASGFDIRHARPGGATAFGLAIRPELVAVGQAIVAGAGIYSAARECGVSPRVAAQLARALLPIIGPDCACGLARFHRGFCRKVREPRTCEGCGTSFTPRNVTDPGRFHSRSCANQWRRKP